MSTRVRENFIGLQTIVIKEVTRVLRIWVQTVVPPAINMTLYFIIFGYVIGSQVRHIGGYPYMTYLAPGLIMMSIITNSYANVVSSFFGAKFARHVEELMVSPLSSNFVLMGYVAGGVVRGLIIGILVTIIATFFTDLQVAHPLVVVSVALLTAIVFSLGGFINAIFAKKFDDISIVPSFVLTPLTYLGGVFYSINLLPEFWQHVSRINPILYMVNAFRFGVLGISDIGIGTAYVVIILFILILYTISFYLLKNGVGLRT